MPECFREECKTTAGCAHRGPKGEWCHFGEVSFTTPWLETRIAALEQRVAELEAYIARLDRRTGAKLLSADDG